MALAAPYFMPGLLFLLTLASGAWLGLLGRPFNSLLFNLHKLIALGAVIVTGLLLRAVLRTAGVQPVPLALVIVAALSAIALFVSGALLSIGRVSYRALVTVHRVAAAVLLGALGVLLYVLGAVASPSP
jgi:hypothetical protein